MNKIRPFLYMLLLAFFSIIFKPFSFINKKKIRFFIDRPFGVDNSYFLYNYVKKHDKSIKSIYLVENEKDKTYKGLEKDKNTVFSLSIKHFWYFIHAENIIISYDTKPFFFYKEGLLFKYILKPLAKIIFIQHGVTKAFIKPYSQRYTHFDLFFCTSKSEKQIIKRLGYSDEQIKITGFPRFDNLFDSNVEKLIMFMPSWKMELYGKTEEEFKRSDYFKGINELLLSPKLNNLLEKSTFKLFFVTHYMMNSYIHLFDIKSKNIQVVNPNLLDKKSDIQHLLKKSSILITDYSSIMFDFAYMKKPIIHYRFDTHHYKELFNVKKDGFGEIIYNTKDVIIKLSEILKNNCVIKKRYLNNVYNFFQKIDGRNCERVYTEIKNFNIK